MIPEIQYNAIETIFGGTLLYYLAFLASTALNNISQVVNDIELFTSSGFYKRDMQSYNTDEKLVHQVDHEQISFREPHKKVTMRLLSCGHDNHIQLKPVASGKLKDIIQTLFRALSLSFTRHLTD